MLYRGASYKYSDCVADRNPHQSGFFEEPRREWRCANRQEHDCGTQSCVQPKEGVDLFMIQLGPLHGRGR